MRPDLLPLAGALVAGLWAALLALAEGALAANPRLEAAALPPVYAEKPERLQRGLAIGRILLLGLAAVQLSQSLRWWLHSFPVALLQASLLTVTVVVVVDLLPRTVGLRRASRVGRWAVRATVATLALPAPIFVAAGILDRAFARLFGVATPRGAGADTAQRDMLLGVFALADTMVSEVMTPRIDIVGLDARASFEDVVRQVAAAEYSRLPVYEGDLDHILGVLYAKDLLPARFGSAPSAGWRALVRSVDIVPEVKTLDRQLRDFQRGPSHMAVVVDEFGGTAGIVTLEDVLEEIVGEIGDEYDAPQGPPVTETAPGVFAVDARASLDDLAAALGVSLEHEEVSTAGGMVYAALGRVPTTGEQVTVAGFQVTVERVEKRRIRRLRFERLPPAEPIVDPHP
jgi:CBS domain containing-hemolysin-like protein